MLGVDCLVRTVLEGGVFELCHGVASQLVRKRVEIVILCFVVHALILSMPLFAILRALQSISQPQVE